MTRTLPVLAYLLLLYVSLCTPQYLNNYNVVGGVTLYSPTVGSAQTTTVTALAHVPTLVYNCYLTPALCANVEARGRAGAGVGNYPAPGHEVFGYDPNPERRKARQQNQCPSNWRVGAPQANPARAAHTCPEANQPPVHPLGITNDVPVQVDPDTHAIVKFNQQTGSFEQTGLMFTCDEFPPAIHVGTSKNFIWEYHFKTVNVVSTMATWVEWVPPGTTTYAREEFAGAKRDLPYPIRVISGIDVHGKERHYQVPMEHTPQSFLEYHMLVPGELHKHTYDMNSSVEAGPDNSDPATSKKEKRQNSETPQAQGSQLLVNETRSQSQSRSRRPSIVQQRFEAAPALPILEIGSDYIFGQPKFKSNATFEKGAKSKSGPSSLENGEQRERAANQLRARKMVEQRAVEGPIQCGVGKPCADGSCCNSVRNPLYFLISHHADVQQDGKCGFKPYHCSPAAPVTCLSNCQSTAMCGVDSAGGLLKCGLNLCCSYFGWCGTEAIHCINADPQGQTTPCQQGFGGCTIVPPPSCGKTSGTSSGRKIAYYQSWNVRLRNCNRVSPKQIKTDGLTHLNFAFASIDPGTFHIVPAMPDDVAMYTEFTALKTAQLQTWIAIGGFDFSDVGPTHTTWSDMASTKANRAAFVASVVTFMDKYGFQGADLDWEYPATDVRGGRPEDTANLVLLCQELRAAFGTKYGLSSILAPDYWYLRGMDPKGMEPYLDFFGFMAYDLHGFWDADVKTLGSIIRPQTDIREIDNNTLPLWFDKLDPAKVNLGLAYYGRGYTVTDRSCGFDGVMSNREIQEIIRSKGLYPEYLREPMIKQISWEDQWIGYDDDETIRDKIALANDRCMGGTMIWSIDFDSGAGSGDIPDGGASTGGGGTGGGGTGTGSGLVSVDSNIWAGSNPRVQCVPPCILVLPPIPLPQMSTISFPALTTSYLLRTTTTLSNQVITTVVTRQTILTIAPVTTSEIELWAVTVFTADPTSAAFTAVQSVTPSPIVVTLPASAYFRPFPTPTGSGATTPTTTPPLGFSSSHAVTIQPQPTHSVSIAPIPTVTYSSGTPESTCTSRCGCGSSNCPGCGPGPPPGSGGDQTGGDENPDEEENREEDRQEYCILMEADLDGVGLLLEDPAPTTDTNPSTRPTTSSTKTTTARPPPPPQPTETNPVISPAPDPPIESPAPNPDPPAPDPSTEKKQCFDSGSWVTRGDAISAVTNFCSRPADADPEWSDYPHYGGYVMKDNEFVEYKIPASLTSGWPVNIVISVQALNGCEFEIDGPSPDQECGRIFRQILDKCDTVSGEARKQGGKVESNCAIWDFDPGFSGDILIEDLCVIPNLLCAAKAVAGS
ncbi:MAG: hypothetical protein Q9208_007364 [Pyrenodesmia sp. 3 TL-2023]